MLDNDTYKEGLAEIAIEAFLASLPVNDAEKDIIRNIVPDDLQLCSLINVLYVHGANADTYEDEIKIEALLNKLHEFREILCPSTSPAKSLN